MANWMAEIDQRTRLAGANKMELLIFSLGTDEIYGINVFKIREVMKLPSVTKIPEADPRILGLVNLRGENIPLVDLKQAIGLGPLEAEGTKLIVTEYNNHKQGFLVAGVERIIRMSWDRIQVPPPMVRTSRKGSVTAVTKLDDGRMVLVLDVEKVLAELNPDSNDEEYWGIKPSSSLKGKRILFADDSVVARKQITKTLDCLGIKWEETVTGKEAWERLRTLADKAQESGKHVMDFVQMVLTDIEMPEMDGFTLTKYIREDPRFTGMPILMHSSLSGECNVKKGESVGVTDYVTKFDPVNLGRTIQRHIG